MADLTPYIAGAGTTLVAQAVLQLYVVPRVELRKRREDRWEKAVVDLGALLGEEVLDAHHEAVQATLTQYVRRPEDSRSNEVVSEAAAVSMRSHRQLVNTRVRMAAEHVVGLDPEAPSLLAFASALNKYRSAVGALALYAPSAHLPHSYTADSPIRQDPEAYRAAQDEAGAAERLHTELFTHVRHLARGRPPRAPLRRHVGRVRRRLRTAARAVTRRRLLSDRT